MVASAKLSQETEERLVHIVATGEYQSADELVIAALDLLEEKQKSDRLDAKLEEGLRSLREGRFVTYSPEWAEKKHQEILERFAAGERADPEYFE
jgi:Arc/MetJ-type ribon-helix-helix transcriptional regulator